MQQVLLVQQVLKVPLVLKVLKVLLAPLEFNQLHILIHLQHLVVSIMLMVYNKQNYIF